MQFSEIDRDERGLDGGLGNFRNSPVNCGVFPAINFESWKTDTPALQVPEAILIQTLEKGTEGLLQRRREEYALWENSEWSLAYFPPRRPI